MEKNPEEYVRRYIYGDGSFETVYMRLGKIFAEIMEGVRVDHPGALRIKRFIPRYKKPEYKIKCVLKRGKERCEVVGILDGYNPPMRSFGALQGEYKTARKAWTLKKAQELFQLKVYALIHHKNTQEIPRQELTWIGTSFDDGNELTFTGEFETFEVKNSMLDILETEARIWRAYDKVMELVNRELKKL